VCTEYSRSEGALVWLRTHLVLTRVRWDHRMVVGESTHSVGFSRTKPNRTEPNRFNSRGGLPSARAAVLTPQGTHYLSAKAIYV
jgi:hypothetical protein